MRSNGESTAASLTEHSPVHRFVLCRFLKNLKMVVVDELHYYSGNLGRSVAFLVPFKRYQAPF